MPAGYNFEIYPNSANDNVRISWQIDIEDNVQIILYNHLGQQVWTLLNELRRQGKNEINFDIKILNNGFYFVKLITGPKFKIEKINIIK
ncbi:MAG: T9SS type A sorting domain-containing protein [Candidatus Kapaibacteriota bacterium]